MPTMSASSNTVNSPGSYCQLRNKEKNYKRQKILKGNNKTHDIIDDIGDIFCITKKHKL